VPPPVPEHPSPRENARLGELAGVSGRVEPWPLAGGLPFPEGELHDASQIRIVGAG